MLLASSVELEIDALVLLHLSFQEIQPHCFCKRASLVSFQRQLRAITSSAASSTIRELQDRNTKLVDHIETLQQAIINILHGDKSIQQPEHPLHAELVALKKKNQVVPPASKAEITTSLVESFGTLTIANDNEHTSWLGTTASSEFFIKVSYSLLL